MTRGIVEDDVIRRRFEHQNEMSALHRRLPFRPSDRVVNGSNEELGLPKHAGKATRTDPCHDLCIDAERLPNERNEGRVDKALDLPSGIDAITAIFRTFLGQFQHGYRAARAGSKDHLQAGHATKIARPPDILVHGLGTR